MVRALKGGEVLELFLDEKLKRLMRHASMVSKILLDDGDFLNEEVTKALAEAKSSSASIVTTTKTLGEATVQLYSVMRQCIKGSRKAIIENVVVHSYVQAVCVFHQRESSLRRHANCGSGLLCLPARDVQSLVSRESVPNTWGNQWVSPSAPSRSAMPCMCSRLSTPQRPESQESSKRAAVAM